MEKEEWDMVATDGFQILFTAREQARIKFWY
jgi:hypothetical protein